MNRIAISGQNGILFIDPREIIYGEASNNYTRIIISNGKTLVISKTLKDVQDVLEDSHFLRIHRQYIINLNCVTHFNRNDSIITMSNQIELPVARNQKEKLIGQYRWL
ncbi:MAG: LytTR family DNA-binding domain-containing protein [Bacteroidota bacterium]